MSSAATIQNGAITRQAVQLQVVHTVTADQDTANSAAITVVEMPKVNEVFGVQITNGSNVRRSPQGAVTKSGNVVTIADSGLAANEVITFTAVGYIG
jgi:hypothetical protein